VAVVDLAGVCEVQSGYWGEFFCGGVWAGEDGSAGAGSDVEDLIDECVVSGWTWCKQSFVVA
jgi:hypothetical protein